MKEISALLLASAAFAAFVLCPRMVGMGVVISRVKGVDPILAVSFGALLSVPLVVAMALVLLRFGEVWALALAVATDLLAAGLIGVFEWKMAAQVLVIAFFIWVGIAVSRTLFS